MPLKTYRDELPTLNLTAMIDIIFQLIIFFMVGAKFTEFDERRIALQVPAVSGTAALSAPPQKKVVNVYRDGRITLQGQSLTLDELTGRLALARREYAGLNVLVRGDAEGRFQRVAEVLSACKQAGISELAISVKLATESEP
jgi:biopolymer transport protein ExbD